MNATCRCESANQELTATAKGDSPQECAENAVTAWYACGDLPENTTCDEPEHVVVDVEGHGKYDVFYGYFWEARAHAAQWDFAGECDADQWMRKRQLESLKAQVDELLRLSAGLNDQSLAHTRSRMITHASAIRDALVYQLAILQESIDSDKKILAKINQLTSTQEES